MLQTVLESTALLEQRPTMLAELLDACVLECTDHDEAVDLVRLIAAAASDAAGSSGDQSCVVGMRDRSKAVGKV